MSKSQSNNEVLFSPDIIILTLSKTAYGKNTLNIFLCQYFIVTFSVILPFGSFLILLFLNDSFNPNPDNTKNIATPTPPKGVKYLTPLQPA